MVEGGKNYARSSFFQGECGGRRRKADFLLGQIPPCPWTDLRWMVAGQVFGKRHHQVKHLPPQVVTCFGLFPVFWPLPGFAVAPT
jgi:hypothetical protein